VEFAPTSWRAVAKGCLAIGWTCGSMFLVFVAWLLRDLHSMSSLVVCVLPAIIVGTLNYFFLPESPRWMLVSGDQRKAHEALTKIAKVNLGDDAVELDTLAVPSTTGGGSFGMLFKGKLIKPTAVIGFSQGVACLSLYGVAFSSESAGASGGPYLSAFLGALVELPAYILMCPMADRLGRRAAYAGFLALGAVAMLFSAYTNEGALNAAAVLISRFSVAGSSTIVYVVSAEQFPTACRNLGVGFGSSCGRIGAIVAPMILEATSAPFVVFAVLSVAAAASVCLLKETKGLNLED